LALQIHFRESEIGYTFQSDSVFVFFGNKKATLIEIERHFPNINFYKIRQTHSDINVEASLTLTEADGHWTKEKNRGLLISTADCSPIMIYNRKSGAIAAVHAGWRGVANQITVKALKKMVEEKINPNDFEIWIGPHILKNSFEVKDGVLNQLLESSYAINTETQFSKPDAGIYVDLKSILESQIQSVIPNFTSLHYLDIDTKTDLRFHSFRRDKEKSGRNLRFIAKI
jgi:YfiH family protein